MKAEELKAQAAEKAEGLKPTLEALKDQAAEKAKQLQKQAELLKEQYKVQRRLR